MKPNTYYYLALLCTIWFLLTSWLWTYWLNLLFSFPFAILSWYFLNKSKEKTSTEHKTIMVLLVLGILSAIVSLLFFIR